MIQQHLDKNNLHHAYLIEGDRDKIVPEIIAFCENIGIKTSGNPDFCHISVDSFKIEDARNLKSSEYEKSFSQNKNAKKIFLISANNFLLEAQNALLKVFEEPIENTHFFLIVPDSNFLLKTLISRFYLIKTNIENANDLKNAEEFIKMPLRNRLDFIKDLIAEKDEEEDIISIDSSKAKALKFINSLEAIFVSKTPGMTLSKKTFFFEHLFKVREFLNQPGSSVKSLMESVALNIPDF